MYPNREVFPNAPLALVAAEVKFGYNSDFALAEAHSALKKALGGFLPVQNLEAEQSVTFSKDSPPQISQSERAYRMMDSESRFSFTVKPDAALIETTSYKEFDDFQLQLGMCLQALGDLGIEIACNRIGLRYINEVRVAGVEEVKDWSRYISADVLGLPNATPKPVEILQGVLQLETSSQTKLSVRYGAGKTGAGIVGGGPLKRVVEPKEGEQVFLIDLDSFWIAQDNGTEQLDAGLIGKILEDLHAPIGETFHLFLSDDLKEVLRNAN
jgi:uncharacterized protein (TIGR04255 family)